MDLVKIGSKTHVIVTGGTGFIGSCLSSRLLENRVRVTILTRHVDAPRAVQLAEKGAKIVRCDLSSAGTVPKTDELMPADVFCHLAADLSLNGSQLGATNVEGTRRALDLAADLKIPYVVYGSSIEAQGLCSDQNAPLSEESACRPESAYGASKREAEQLVTHWASPPIRESLILRIGNVYGPGSLWLFDASLRALLHAAPLRSFWPRLRHRAFQPLYIDDLIEGLLRAIERRLTGMYNLTGEEPLTIEAFLESLARLTGLTDQLAALHGQPADEAAGAHAIEPDFAYVLMGSDGRCHRLYDNGKLRACIGDYARWPLSRGLAATLSWYHATGGLRSCTSL